MSKFFKIEPSIQQLNQLVSIQLNKGKPKGSSSKQSSKKASVHQSVANSVHDSPVRNKTVLPIVQETDDAIEVFNYTNSIRFDSSIHVDGKPPNVVIRSEDYMEENKDSPLFEIQYGRSIFSQAGDSPIVSHSDEGIDIGEDDDVKAPSKPFSIPISQAKPSHPFTNPKTDTEIAKAEREYNAVQEDMKFFYRLVNSNGKYTATELNEFLAYRRHTREIGEAKETENKAIDLHMVKKERKATEITHSALVSIPDVVKSQADIAFGQLNAMSIGVVIMGESSFYDHPNPQRDHHLPKLTPQDLLQELTTQFPKIPNIDQIVMGHEHGEKLGKCHYQCFVKFSTPCRLVIKPFKFINSQQWINTYTGDTESVSYLAIVTKAKNPHALQNYCKKEGDYAYLYPERVIKNVVNSKGKVNSFATVYQNRQSLDSNAALDIIMMNDSKQGFTSYKNIKACISEIVRPPLKEFAWQFPKHLIEFGCTDNAAHLTIYKWFKQWCVPEGLDRRRGLVLYSSKRCIGKTRFALSLVPDERYAIVFRNTFTREALNDREQARLVVLDDMTHYTKENKEMWKALLVGQQTSIRDCYANFLFEFKLPCIVTTNNREMFKNMMVDNEFRESAFFVEVTSYIGPPGTEPKAHWGTVMVVSDELMKEVEEKKIAREEYKKSHFK